MAFEVWFRKAERFREYAREDLANNRFDSAAFFAQQAIEVLLKELLIKLIGTRPITYSTAELLQYLAKTLNAQPPSDVVRCAEALEVHYTG